MLLETGSLVPFLDSGYFLEHFCMYFSCWNWKLFVSRFVTLCDI